MPLVQISMIEGRSVEQKRELIRGVTDAIVETTQTPKEAIRVIINEVPSTNWGKEGLPASDFGR